MGFLRNILVFTLGYLAIKTMKRAILSAEAQKVKVKATADAAAARIPTLRMDPVTGVYRPEA